MGMGLGPRLHLLKHSVVAASVSKHVPKAVIEEWRVAFSNNQIKIRKHNTIFVKRKNMFTTYKCLKRLLKQLIGELSVSININKTVI